jgi:two-component system, OmpR family, phosphate regulon sensor histidine kinase PhoR
MFSLRLLFSIFALVMVLSSATLAYLSANSAVESEQLTTESLIANTTRLAEEKVDRIERKLIDTENVLLDLMSGVDEIAFLQRWDDYVGPSPVVKSVALFGQQGEILARLTSRPQEERGGFFALLTDKISGELGIGEWPVGLLKHLHTQHQKRFYLFAYQARSVQGRILTTLIEIDMDNILGDIFPKTFDSLHDEFQFVITDQSNAVIYGEPFTSVGPYTKEIQFPSTLYRWRLTLAPRQADALLQASAARVRLRYELFALSAFVLLVGLFGIGYAVARERTFATLQADFVSNVSHELKTPLSLIRMFSEMLRFGPARDEKKTQGYIEIIHREGERLALLIDNVLDFSRFEQREAKRVTRPFSLDDVTTRAVEALRPRLLRDGHQLIVSIDPVPDCYGDPEAISLAVQNLLDNAGKFAEAPSEIRVKTMVERGEAVLSIEDTGPGISPEDLPHIFERFFRGKRQGEKPVRGSGIGLSLVFSIVKQHKGTINAESELGKGSRFIIRLPLHPVV